MSEYTNDNDGASQLRAMLRIVVRQTIWRTSACWVERRSRRLPDNWLNERLTEAENEAVTELLTVLRTLGIAP